MVDTHVSYCGRTKFRTQPLHMLLRCACNFLASTRCMPVATHVIRASTKQVTHPFFKSITLKCLQYIEAV